MSFETNLQANINSIAQDPSTIALKNHIAQENRNREIYLMKESEFKKIKTREGLEDFLKQYNETEKYVNYNILSNEKPFMYEYLFDKGINDKSNVGYALKYSLLKNDCDLLNKALSQESAKELMSDNHEKSYYLKISSKEGTQALIDKVDFTSQNLTEKLNYDLSSGSYKNIDKLIEKGANKDNAFLELVNKNNGQAINELTENQNFSKDILEQGLINSVKKGQINYDNTEELNIFNDSSAVSSFQGKDSNVFSVLYQKYEFSNETYEKVIKESINNNKCELITDIIKDKKMIIQDTDLTAIKVINPEEYEPINKINMKNKLDDKLKNKVKKPEIDYGRKI